MNNQASGKSDNFIVKLIDLPVIVGISEFTELAKHTVNELHMGRIIQCLLNYSRGVFTFYICEISIDEPICVGSFNGNRLVVGGRHLSEYPDRLLEGEDWTVYISLIKNGADLPVDLTQASKDLLYLGFGHVKPPEKWDELLQIMKRVLPQMTDEQRIPALKMNDKIYDFFGYEKDTGKTKMKRGFRDLFKLRKHK